MAWLRLLWPLSRANPVTAGQTNSSVATEPGFPPDLFVALDRTSPRGLREQLEGELRRAVRDGRLAIGTALPPSRVLARELGVARSVVVDAYGQLAAEGYLEARQGSGTRVRATHPREPSGDAALRRRPEAGPRLLGGLPDPASFPRAQWQRHYRAAIGALSTSSLSYPDPRGHRALRAALAAYLGRVRAVVTTPENVQVCGGFTQGLALVCRALRAQGARRLAVEDPCFSYHRELIANAGLEPVPVPVDDNGVDVRALAALDEVAGILVAPAHSYPTGAVLAPQRRVELTEWARAADTLIIEDDYDAEFRYDRAPIGALQGLRPDRVVYGGSVSKTLSPILRVGWLAGPEWLMADLRREKLYDDLATGTLDQLALATFIESGDLARHLRRVRPVYRRRRDAALRALADHLPDATPVGVAAGLHLYVHLPPECDEHQVVHAARRQGVRLEGAARHWAQADAAPPALVIGYGMAAEPAIEQGIRALGAAYAVTVRGSPGANGANGAD
jgi:GntR family transcriptional regulator / MocR family aminotransferase